MDKNTTFLKRWSSLFILLGAVLWSTNAPFFKILQVDAYLAVFIRASIAGVILLPTLRPRQLKWDASLLIMLLSYTGLCIGVVLAIRTTSTNIATGLQYTAPVWIFLLSWWRGKTKFSWRAHWPLLVLLAGLVVSMCSACRGPWASTWRPSPPRSGSSWSISASFRSPPDTPCTTSACATRSRPGQP